MIDSKVLAMFSGGLQNCGFCLMMEFFVEGLVSTVILKNYGYTYLFLPWPLPEGQAMVLPPPCKGGERHLTNRQEQTCLLRSATEVE